MTCSPNASVFDGSFVATSSREKFKMLVTLEANASTTNDRSTDDDCSMLSMTLLACITVNALAVWVIWDTIAKRHIGPCTQTVRCAPSHNWALFLLPFFCSSNEPSYFSDIGAAHWSPMSPSKTGEILDSSLGLSDSLFRFTVPYLKESKSNSCNKGFIAFPSVSKYDSAVVNSWETCGIVEWISSTVSSILFREITISSSL